MKYFLFFIATSVMVGCGGNDSAVRNAALNPTPTPVVCAHDPEIVFEECVGGAWMPGIYEGGEEIQYYGAGGSTANASWAIVDLNDGLHGKVIDVRLFQNTGFADFAFHAMTQGGTTEDDTTTFDLSDYAGGQFVFDLRVMDFGLSEYGIFLNVQCEWPCRSQFLPAANTGTFTSLDYPELPFVAEVGTWMQVIIPVEYLTDDNRSLTDPNLNLSNVDVISIAPPWASPTEQIGVHYQLDNIRWVAPAPESTVTLSPEPSATPTTEPTATTTPLPTATPVPLPTATPTTEPTAPPTPLPTATPMLLPTATPLPFPTATLSPVPTPIPDECAHDPQIVFAECLGGAWNPGIYENNEQTQYYGTSGSTANASWSIVDLNDGVHGKVIDVRLFQNTGFADFAFHAMTQGGTTEDDTTTFDLSDYEGGQFVFDLRVMDFGLSEYGIFMNVQCEWPCRSQFLPVANTTGFNTIAPEGFPLQAELGTWMQVVIPVEYLTNDNLSVSDPDLDLSNIDVISIAPPWASSTEQIGVHYQLDNIRWVH